jgi:replicative DNA helicase
MLGPYDQVQHWQQAVQKADSGPRIGLSLPAIDAVLEGVQPGELLGIMARPGIGKTLVLCHVAQGLAGFGHVCLSLEMPAAQIIERLARMVYEVNKYTLRRELKQDDFDAGKYLEAFAGLLLDATPGLSVAQILARVRRAQASQRVTVVTIDHLGLLGGDPKLTTYDRVSKQARELKELAKRCDVAVILLIQANRDAGGDGSRELHLGSARDSGVIEEACDYLIALRRLDRSLTLQASERERFKDAIFAKVIKHRHGIPMTEEVAYRINPVSLRLVEDRELKADENDLKKLALLPGGRR